MTVEGPDGYRYLVRRDGSLVMDGDGHPRPIKLDELTPESARIVRDLLRARTPREDDDHGADGGT